MLKRERQAEMTYPFYFYKRVTKRGNNFAIGSDGIGEALQRSASSMYAAGNTMEQTIGLVTAAEINWLKNMETYFYRTYLNALIA